MLRGLPRESQIAPFQCGRGGWGSLFGMHVMGKCLDLQRSVLRNDGHQRCSLVNKASHRRGGHILEYASMGPFNGRGRRLSRSWRRTTRSKSSLNDAWICTEALDDLLRPSLVQAAHHDDLVDDPAVVAQSIGDTAGRFETVTFVEA